MTAEADLRVLLYHLLKEKEEKLPELMYHDEVQVFKSEIIKTYYKLGRKGVISSKVETILRELRRQASMETYVRYDTLLYGRGVYIVKKTALMKSLEKVVE